MPVSFPFLAPLGTMSDDFRREQAEALERAQSWPGGIFGESGSFGGQVSAPDTDENRTSEPSLGTRLLGSAVLIPGLGPAITGGAAAVGGVKNAVDTYLPNVVLIVVGVVLLIAGVMLWGRYSGDAVARYGRKVANA